MSSIQAIDPKPARGNAAVPPPPPVPVAGETYKHSETTRLLSSAAYLNGGFREEVLKYTVENRHSALGACFGLDIATVVRHCGNARRLLDRRAWWLLVPGSVALFLCAVALANQEFTPQVFLLLVLVYGLSFAVCFYFDSRANSIVRHNFLRSNFNPDALGGESTPVNALGAVENGNTVIYSGFNPFVGSGENMGAWSFALDLRKRADELTGPPKTNTRSALSSALLAASQMGEITLEALYARVAEDIAALELERVTVQDKLYINGRDIRDDARFLSDPLAKPTYRVDEQTMRFAMLEQEEKQLRHYRCIRVVDWSGELVLSIFLRFSRLSHNLFVEASYFLLTPISEGYRTVDTLCPDRTFAELSATAVGAAVKAPFLCLFAPLAVVARGMKRYTSWSEGRKQDEMIRHNPAFDYGASFSFRQWASGNEYRRYFQRLDKEMYLKVLEKNILDSIITFLEEKDVDVSELKQRQTMILNQGVILSGGSMSAENLSVGLGAKVENAARKVTKMAVKAAPPAA